jgi:hypothetical protein
MPFRLLLIATFLAALLGGCVTTIDGDDLQRMQRNQDATRETAA